MIGLTSNNQIPYSFYDLFTMGNSEPRATNIVVTGSREVDSYLLMNIKKFSLDRDLSSFHFICGGALGTDSIFATEVSRVGVGIDLYVPQILKRHRALHSKFPGVNIIETEKQESVFHKGMLLARNRRMVDISRAVILFKAGIEGGSMYTANYAISRGIPVYVESNIPRLNSGYLGNVMLLNNGCRKLIEFA